MAHQSTRPFTANTTPSARLLLCKTGCNVVSSHAKLAKDLRRGRRTCTVVAQSNPVAEVQQTLQRTVSGVADKLISVADDTIDQAKGLDLREVILLQGAFGADGTVHSYWQGCENLSLLRAYSQILSGWYSLQERVAAELNTGLASLTNSQYCQECAQRCMMAFQGVC